MRRSIPLLLFPLLALFTSCARGPALQYQNPVYNQDFPDPFILTSGGAYYAYSTNARGQNVPTLRSDDLAAWEEVGDALPQLPAWAAAGQSLTWAPAVLEIDGRFVLYYTARYRAAGKQCISRAVSDQPAGPFVDDSPAPFVCQEDLGGSIDPSPFVDQDGRPYLLWKSDGNCCGLPIHIWIQPLAPGGLSLEGQAKPLITPDQFWEFPLVEGPSMLQYKGKYYLFYSGGEWNREDYAVGLALCETVTGPCAKPGNEPLMAKTGDVLGPGGQEVFRDLSGNLWLAYHAWTKPNVGYERGGARTLHIAPLEIRAGSVTVLGP